jgi:hypothetical protein
MVDHQHSSLIQWIKFLPPPSKSVQVKLDTGKSCIRFKKPDHMLFDRIGQLMKKISFKAGEESGVMDGEVHFIRDAGAK